ncbi:MAG: hypothetical protein ACRC33_26975 [Gemmataceae bacterium]
MFDRLLVRPTVLEICAALREAQRAANAVFVTLKHDPEHWQAVVAGLRDRPAGRMQWMRRVAGQRGWVGMTWWTDPDDRRHFRVVGACMWDGKGKTGPFGVLADAPPVATLYDGVCVYRRHARADGWVQMCRCGAVVKCGAPGWMGPGCVSCHLREAAGVPCPDAGPLQSYPARGASSLVTVGQETLVVRPAKGLTREGRICQLDGTVRFRLPGAASARMTAGSADGRFFAFVGQASHPSDGRPRRLVILDLRDGGIVLDRAAPESPAGMRFARDGKQFVLEDKAGTHVHAWSEGGRRWRHSFTAMVGETVSSPAGDRTLWVEAMMMSGKDRPLRPLPVPAPLTGRGGGSFTFGGDGDSLTGLWDETLDWRDQTRRLWLLRWAWDGDGWRLSHHTPMGEPRHRNDKECWVVSPDGRWLARRGFGAVIRVHDVNTGKCVGRVGWPQSGGVPEELRFARWRRAEPRAFRFTPDGRSLIVVTARRLLVVPWARLLNVPMEG